MKSEKEWVTRYSVAGEGGLGRDLVRREGMDKRGRRGEEGREKEAERV